MKNENPFILNKIECPICKTLNEFEMIRVGSYTEDGRDTDFCPMGITWRYPRYQAYNPLAFFTATCSNCFYTRELTNKYKEWKSDNNFRTYKLKQIKDKHLEQLSTADSLIKKIGERIDVHRNPNESAILKLHLAIYDELLAEHYSDLDLGRFYIRIAWLFRDSNKNENPQLQHIKGLMFELDNKFGMLSQSLDNVEQEIDNFKNHLNSHFETDQIQSIVQSDMLSFSNRFDTPIDNILSGNSNLKSSLNEISEVIEEYKSLALGNDVSTGDENSSFMSFLSEIHKQWPLVVASEHAAMEKAVMHYKKAFASGKDIASGTPQIQASYLIAELSRRIGDYDGAKQYFTSTIKAGQDFIYKNRQDQSRTVLPRKILELAIEQGKLNLKASQS